MNGDQDMYRAGHFIVPNTAVTDNIGHADIVVGLYCEVFFSSLFIEFFSAAC